MTATAGNKVDLTWDASTDNVRVVGYKIIRNGTAIAVSPVPSYSDATVQPTTSYDYRVVAFDFAGNDSPPSATRSVTTTDTLVLTFSPTADAYVDATNPDQAFGTETTLWVDGNPTRDMLLKFGVSGTNAWVVESVKLRLYTTNSSGSGGDVYSLADMSWSESTVTWNNVPDADTSLVASQGSVVSGAWHEVDVTSAFVGDGLVAFRVNSSSPDGASYSSKEGLEAPQLEVIVSAVSAGGHALPPPDSPYANGESSARINDWLHDHLASWRWNSLNSAVASGFARLADPIRVCFRPCEPRRRLPLPLREAHPRVLRMSAPGWGTQSLVA